MISSQYSSYLLGYITIILLIISSNSIVVGDVDVEWSISAGGNGHFYRSLDLQTTNVYSPIDAAQACASNAATLHPGYNGYLATFTSQDEWDFVIAYGIVQVSAAGATYWISGTQNAIGQWTYNSGPENNQLMYNLFTDRCYGYCGFKSLEPGINPSYTALHTSSDELGNVWWLADDSSGASVFNYVCEYSINDPVIPKTPVTGGNIIISQLSGFVVNSGFTVSFAGVSGTISCAYVSFTTDTFTCTLPPGMIGSYDVILTDATLSKEVLKWTPYPPFVGGIYTARNQGEQVTILGRNFGTDASKIEVFVTNNTIPCTNIQLLPNYDSSTGDTLSFVCTLSSPLGNLPFLPIKISVGGVTSTSYKSPVFCIDRFYSASYWEASYLSSLNTVRDNYLLGSQKPFMATVDSIALATCLSKSLPTLGLNKKWNLWQGVNFNTDGTFTYNNGPNNGSTMAFPTGITVNNVGMTPTSTIGLELTNTPTVNAITSGSPLIGFGGAPKWKTASKSSGPTFGGTQTYEVDDIGTLYTISKMNVSIQLATGRVNVPINSVTYGGDFSTISVTIPPGFSTDNLITYTIDNRSSISTPGNATYHSYSPPTSSSMFPTQVTTEGGLVTFFGANFYPSDTVSALVLNQNIFPSCNYTSYGQMNCFIPRGTGTLNAFITVGNQRTADFVIQYANPSIQNTSIVTNKLLIDGTNFGYNTSLMSVTIGGSYTCKSIQLVSIDISILCIIDDKQVPPLGSSVSLSMSVNGKTSNVQTISLLPTIYSIDKKPYIQGDNITITAYFADPAATILIQFGSMTQPLSCTNIASTVGYIYRCAIPPGDSDFQLIVQSQGFSSIPFNTTYQEPIIISSTSLNKGQPGLITIYGRSFSNNITAITAFIQDVPCTSPSLITLYAPGEDTTLQKLQCLYDASVDDSNIQGKSLNVTVKVSQLIGVNQVFIYNPSQKVGCPNNCSNHGTCNYNFGDCLCDSGYELNIDCSIFTDPSNNNNNQTSTPTTNTQAETSMTFESSKAINFTTSIRFIREVDVDDSSLKVISMENVQWTIDSNTSTYYGKLSNETVEFEVKVTPYTNATTIEFAGQPLQMTPNSVKYHIRISNYTWTSMLSTLQVIFLSESDSLELDACGSPITTIQQNEGDSIYWTKVRVGQSVLNTKFASRMILDNRIVQSNVKKLSENDALQQLVEENNPDGLNVLTAITLFHFGNEAEIDPAFSALLVEDNSSNIDNNGCGNNDEKFATWKMITIVVVCGVAIIAVGATIFVLKKKQIRLHFTKRVNSVSMKRIVP